MTFDRIFTEGELRKRVDDNLEEIARSLIGRLRDDGQFDPVH